MKQFAEQKELNSEELQLVVLHNPRNVSRSTVTEGRAVVAEETEGLEGRLQTVADMFLILYTVMAS